MNRNAAVEAMARREETGAHRPIDSGRALLAFRLSRAMVYLAAFVLLAAFAAPLWHYDFSAPQYPEGLPMTIYINHLGGRIDLVNELNHYVGMLKIDEKSFPELTVMPWLVAILCVGDIAAAASGRLWAVGVWLVFFAASSLILLGDFWWWLYAYGHNLDPHAAIRIAPFTPRLFGSYTLMNFHIVSYPGWGGIAMAASFGLGLFGFLIGWFADGWRDRYRVPPVSPRAKEK
jgi:copper chaperone NosL